jgi:hypothetical protein
MGIGDKAESGFNIDGSKLVLGQLFLNIAA